MSELNEQLKSMNINLREVIDNAVGKAEELLRLDFIKEAEILVKQLLVVDAENLHGLQLYGLILYRQRKYLESIEIQKKAIALDDSNAENHNNIALSYLHSGQLNQAKSEIEKSLQLTPNDYNRLNNAGVIYRSIGDDSQAIVHFKRAIEIAPTDHKGWENLGSIYGSQKRLDEAIDCFHKAIELNDKDLAAHIDLAYAYSLKGEWEKAWPEYEHRIEYWHSVGRNPGRFYDIYKPENKWTGKNPHGLKIMIYCEQGNGDMIQFARFIPLLTEQGAEVYIDCPESMKSLFEGIANTNKDVEYDCHCSILSLPYLLNKMSAKDFQGDKPYFFAERLDKKDYINTFNIGICWSGNPGHPNDVNRSIPLKFFKEISEIPHVKLFSLQKELGKRVYMNLPGVEIDLTEGCENMKLVDLSELMVDYKTTASLINTLDLVLTVDTSVLHLAGALGKETWALIPYNPDWRWLLEGEKTVWYDKVTLHRQPNSGDWKTVFDNIKEKIIRRLEPNIQYA